LPFRVLRSKGRKGKEKNYKGEKENPVVHKTSLMPQSYEKLSKNGAPLQGRGMEKEKGGTVFSRYLALTPFNLF
jgi:hypothetical protein